MQQKEIHKIVNLNKLIHRYMMMYGGYVTIEKTMMYNFIELHKIYTFDYCGYEFSILIVDNRYRLVDYKGDFFESDNIEDFKYIVKCRLWCVYGDI